MWEREDLNLKALFRQPALQGSAVFANSTKLPWSRFSSELRETPMCLKRDLNYLLLRQSFSYEQ